MPLALSAFAKFAGAEALCSHLQLHGIDATEGISSDAGETQLAKQLKALLDDLEPETYAAIHRDFERAEQFAGEDVQAVLRSTCLRSNCALAELERWSNDRARALAILREEPQVFEDAETQLGVHKLLENRRLWSGFQLASVAAPSWTEDRRDAFEKAVLGVYSAKAGVKRRVRVEIDQRDRLNPDGAPCPPAVQATIFHEGDTNREAVFEHFDKVVIEEIRPALRAALVFEASTGTVEVASTGGRKVQQRIAEAFADAFWAERSELTRLKPANFALQRLKAPLHLLLLPVPGLRSACLVGMVLRARGSDRLDVTLHHPDPGLSMPLWEVAEKQFGAGNPLRDPAMLAVTAKIRFEFEPGSSETSSKFRTVQLSLGNGSSKAKLIERHQRIVEECLSQCGLAGAEQTPEPTAPAVEAAE